LGKRVHPFRFSKCLGKFKEYLLENALIFQHEYASLMSRSTLVRLLG